MRESQRNSLMLVLLITIIGVGAVAMIPREASYTKDFDTGDMKAKLKVSFLDENGDIIKVSMLTYNGIFSGSPLTDLQDLCASIGGYWDGVTCHDDPPLPSPYSPSTTSLLPDDGGCSDGWELIEDFDGNFRCKPYGDVPDDDFWPGDDFWDDYTSVDPPEGAKYIVFTLESMTLRGHNVRKSDLSLVMKIRIRNAGDSDWSSIKRKKVVPSSDMNIEDIGSGTWKASLKKGQGLSFDMDDVSSSYSHPLEIRFYSYATGFSSIDGSEVESNMIQEIAILS